MKTKFTLAIALISMFSALQLANSANVVFNVTVPTGTNACWIVGNFNSWNNNDKQMTMVDATHYTITLDDSTWPSGVTTTTIEYKYLSGGGDWSYNEVQADGTNLSGDGNRVGHIDGVQDVVARWAAVWQNVLPVPGYFTIDMYAPKTVTECYLTGNFNGWLTPGSVGKQDSTSTKMTLVPDNSDANGNYFTIKIYTSNAYTLAFQFTTGPSWIYQQVQGNDSYPDVSISSALFDAVGDATKTPPVAPAITFKRIYPGTVGLKDVTLTTTVPANTTTAYVMGSLNGGANTDFIAGTNNNNGTFTFSVPGVDIFNYNYYSTANASAIEVNADNSAAAGRVADAQIQTAFTDVVAAWVSTGVKQINSDLYKVYSNNKSIVVEGVKSSVEVLSIDGRHIQSVKLNGTFTSKTLNSGIYIIRVDGATQKVAVN
jgi:hypothetical protein